MTALFMNKKTKQIMEIRNVFAIEMTGENYTVYHFNSDIITDVSQEKYKFVGFLQKKKH